MNSYDDIRVPLRAAAAGQTGVFLNAVYGWMCFGLVVTAATAWLTASSPALVRTILANGPLFWVLAFVQLAIVFVLSARVQQMAATTAAMLFIAYSALTGVTLSFVLLLYTGQSVASTFVVTAGMFGSLALYGTVTKRNLSGFGQFLFMGVIGLLLASLVGMFWHNDGLQFMISIIGVFVFAGLTVYDAQRLKSMAFATNAGSTSAATIVGALALYLDFINLFLFLLRFLGNRRSDY